MNSSEKIPKGNALSLPKGWVETTLGEVCEITSSKRIFAKEYQTFGIPFFRGKEVTEKFKGNEISTELFITEEKYNEIKNKYGVPVAGDILLTSVGTLGNPYLVEKDFKFYFKDGNLTWFKNFNGVNSKFLFYWFVSPQGRENLLHAKIGSTQQAYTMSALKTVEITIPQNIEEQKAIAKILTSFDDKIELLQAQNKTLETIAQTIFKEWFGKYQVVIWKYAKGALNQHLFKVTSKDYPKWFYYFWTLHHLKEFKTVAANKATTMGHINRKHLDEAIVFIPNQDDMELVGNKLSVILGKLESNNSQIQTLKQTRDTLLPKLMSGQLRVDEFKEGAI